MPGRTHIPWCIAALMALGGCAAAGQQPAPLTPANPPDRQLMAVEGAPDIAAIGATLPKEISEADAKTMLVNIDPAQIDTDNTYSLQRFGGRGGFGGRGHGGFGRHGGWGGRGFGRYGGFGGYGGYGWGSGLGWGSLGWGGTGYSPFWGSGFGYLPYSNSLYFPYTYASGVYSPYTYGSAIPYLSLTGRTFMPSVYGRFLI